MISKGISKCSHLSDLQLKIEYIKIGIDGSMFIAKEIAKFINLSILHLDLKSNPIGEEGTKVLIQGI